LIKHFTAFTFKYNGLAPRLLVDVQLSEAWDPAIPGSTAPSYYSAKALIDTGSTMTMITPQTAAAMSLPVIGQTSISHAGGIERKNVYAVNVVLRNQVQFPGVNAVEVSCPNGEFGALIGMDIILGGDLSVSNVGGLTCVTFRMPSIQVADFALEAKRIKYANVGKNTPCPCGARDEKGETIKFKLCHGKDL
jgi:predicted aspartyl protease